MAVLIGIVLIGSFGYAFYVGGFNQDEAYLTSATRAWELAFGGLLGLLGAGLALPGWMRIPAGWIGVGLIVSSGFVLDGAQLFPGPWALWPLLGLTLVLASAGPGGAASDSRATAARFMSNRAFAWIGDHAYGLYLWHWPLLIFYLEIRAREAVGIRGAALIFAVSLVLAIAMRRFVELPLQTWSRPKSNASAPARNRVALASAMVVLLIGGVASTTVIHIKDQEPAAVFEDWDWETYPGALAVDGEPVPDAAAVPSLDALSGMRPDYYGWDCRQPGNDNPGTEQVRICEDPDAPEEPSATVVLAGGSHAGQWHHAFRALTAEYGWKLKIADRGSCFFHVSDGPEVAKCMEWQGDFIDWVDSEGVDLVVTPGSRISPEDATEYIAEGAVGRWTAIRAAGAEILLIRGTPPSTFSAADCLASDNSPETCGPLVGEISSLSPLEDLDLPEEVSVIDVLPHVCPAAFEEDGERCSAVVGNVVVWYDASHMTPVYVETLTPVLEVHLRDEVPWLFE